MTIFNVLYVRELHERYGPVVSSSAQRSVKSSLNYPIIGLIEEKTRTGNVRDRRGQISERQMQNRKRKRRKEKSNVMARKQIKSQKK